MASRAALPVILFGYDSSAFTQKIRLALKMRQIPYTFIIVPSMMPRPTLVQNFNITYRKIPVMAIGKEVYIDTSLILETLALHPSYPPSPSHPPLHTSPSNRALTRLLTSHYTDRPLFRLTCGLMPQLVWETHFGTDRAGLIGHKLDPIKLGRKIPRNLAGLDTYLSIIEPLFKEQKWFVDGDSESPGAADLALFYQLDWGEKISRGEGVQDLTGGEAPDGGLEDVMTMVFNEKRYPGLLSWFNRFKSYVANLPSTETRIERSDENGINDTISQLNAVEQEGPVPFLDTDDIPQMERLDERNGLVVGKRVSVAPDDTGMNDPTLGTLVGASCQEVVIVPDLVGGVKARVEGVRVHFPRVGFVVLPVGEGRQEVRTTVGVEKAKL